MMATWQLENERCQRVRELMNSSYFMTLEDFKTVLLPALNRFPFVGDAPELSDELATLLWLASTEHKANAEHFESRAIAEARDSLIRYLHPSILKTCSQLRHHYEVLRREKNAGSDTVRVVVRTECKCLHATLDGVEISVNDALSAYYDSTTNSPLFPPAETYCAGLDNPDMCSVCLTAVEPPAPGDNSEFAAQLKKILGHEVDKTLPENWRDLIGRPQCSQLERE
jgi:hypothetical protein